MTFFLYLAQAALYGLIMWGIYCATWRNRPYHRASRIFLLLAAVAPLALPLIRLPVSSSALPGLPMIMLPEIIVGNISHVSKAALIDYQLLLSGLYAAVAVFLMGVQTLRFLRLKMLLRNGQSIRTGRYRIQINTGIGPGTLWRQIFFPGEEVNATILQHEAAHISARHRWDALLMLMLRILLWPMPALWFIARELRMIHEFEADAIAAQSNEPQDYAALLLSQVFGVSPLSLSHYFFHHPLKRRILMLQKTVSRTRPATVLALSMLLTATLAASVLFAQAVKKQPQQATKTKPSSGSTVKHAPNSNAHISPLKPGDHISLPDGRIVYKFVDKMPVFKGELNDWLSKNLQYPDNARKAGEQGRSVIQFIINETGRVTDANLVRSSSHAALDDEALRIVSAMPDWTPGNQDGQAVPVQYTLPVTFKLD